MPTAGPAGGGAAEAHRAGDGEGLAVPVPSGPGQEVGSPTNCPAAAAATVRMPRSGKSSTRRPDGRYSARPAEAQLSREMPEARECDPRNHRAHTCETIQVTSNYVANLG